MAVKVRVHDLGWFYEDRRNYVYFSTLIEGMPDKVYSTELIKYLNEVNWQKWKKHLFWRFFIVYVCYVISAIVYMERSLLPENEGKEQTTNMRIFCGVTFALWL